MLCLRIWLLCQRFSTYMRTVVVGLSTAVTLAVVGVGCLFVVRMERRVKDASEVVARADEVKFTRVNWAGPEGGRGVGGVCGEDVSGWAGWSGGAGWGFERSGEAKDGAGVAGGGDYGDGRGAVAG